MARSVRDDRLGRCGPSRSQASVRAHTASGFEHWEPAGDRAFGERQGLAWPRRQGRRSARAVHRQARLGIVGIEPQRARPMLVEGVAALSIGIDPHHEDERDFSVAMLASHAWAAASLGSEFRRSRAGVPRRRQLPCRLSGPIACVQLKTAFALPSR